MSEWMDPKLDVDQIFVVSTTSHAGVVSGRVTVWPYLAHGSDLPHVCEKLQSWLVARVTAPVTAPVTARVTV